MHTAVFVFCMNIVYSLNIVHVYVNSGVSVPVSYRCQWDISISSISSLRFTHSKHALGGEGGA